MEGEIDWMMQKRPSVLPHSILCAPPAAATERVMYKLYPPFRQRRVTALQALNVLLRIFRFDKRQHNILNNEPPFAIMKSAANFLGLENSRFSRHGHSL